MAGFLICVILKKKMIDRGTIKYLLHISVPGAQNQSWGIFVEIDNNTLYESIFLLCKKSLDIKIMFHEDICNLNILNLIID